MPPSESQISADNLVTTSVEACATTLLSMIRTGRLAPGQQIRQDALAAELGVSRTPLRQALNTLLAEGLVRHTPNVGYFVVRLSAGELAEVYLVREVLEEQLLRTIDFGKLDMGGIKALAAEIETVMERQDVHEITRLNREFHFAIFSASELNIVRRFVTSAWSMSEGYRSIYVAEPIARERVAQEHLRLVTALERRDLDEVIAVANAHRSAARDIVSAFIGRP
jgi:DNA-binding GntR family transcriptional regulator